MIFSVILEQRAITVVVCHTDTLKHCVTSPIVLLFLSASPHKARLKRHFDVIFKTAGYPNAIDRIGLNMSRF